MKQKFTFKIDKSQGILKLSEAAEADPGTFITVHEETYDLEEMKEAALHGQSNFIEKMRRRNLFPPFDLAAKLFDAALNMFGDDPSDGTIVEYEDIDSLPLSDHEAIHFGHLTDDEEDVEIEDILKDDPDDLSEDDIKEIDSDDDTPRFETDDDSEHEN
ncbi:MAG: hypothetical protein HQK73_01510 [Desulfamplus sp.]|nr:hypothetical protein [Desulfamplus sp.]MBF0412823.1 hypothetical protein [Desulfamplus sp.]